MNSKMKHEDMTLRELAAKGFSVDVFYYGCTDHTQARKILMDLTGTPGEAGISDSGATRWLESSSHNIGVTVFF